jgi:thiamine transport system permease protein
LEKSLFLRKLVGATVLLVLLFPLFNILRYGGLGAFEWEPSLITIVWGAIVQSGLSTIITMSMGTLGAMGLLQLRFRVSQHLFRWFSFLLVVPSFIPPLIIITLAVATLSFLPRGLWGVVFFHVFMNVGLASLLLYSSFWKNWPPAIREARILGAHTNKILTQVLFPIIVGDIISISFYFFVLYFLSFSIPLLVGGFRYGGIEVFIYERVLLYGQWGESIYYALMLFLIILFLSRWVKVNPVRLHKEQSMNPTLVKGVGSPYWVTLSCWPLVILVVSLFLSSLKLLNTSADSTFWLSLRGTFIVGMTTGTFLFVMLSMVSFCFLNQVFARILMSLFNPGWVLVGFSFLLLGVSGVTWPFLVLGLSLTIVYFPFLYRLAFNKHLGQLQSQVLLAQTFPVSWWRIWAQIIWPQSLVIICFLSGIAALWACGDFAMSEILLSTDLSSTLALDIKRSLETYRSDEALVLLYPLLLISFIVFMIFQGIAYVTCRNILSRSWTL